MANSGCTSPIRSAWPVAVLLGLGCGEDALRPDGAARAALPPIDYCDQARDWPVPWEHTEQQAIDIVDALRERGGDCGTEGYLHATPSLRLHGALTCAARAHAVAMADAAFFGHTAPDEPVLEARIETVDYRGSVIEHLAAGAQDAEHAVDQVWGSSDQHCADLLSGDHIDVGLGFVGNTVGEQYPTYWVILLGDPSGS